MLFIYVVAYVSDKCGKTTAVCLSSSIKSCRFPLEYKIVYVLHSVFVLVNFMSSFFLYLSCIRKFLLG
jgi:hypothetical protein